MDTSPLLRRAGAAGLLLLLPALGAGVHAQQLPGTLSPGQVEKQFERVPIPEPPVEDFVPGRRDLEAPSGAEAVEFRLAGVRFDGVTVFEPPALEELSADFLDRDVSLVDLYTLANRVTAMYRNAGYVLSQALVPAQEIGEDRVATIRVVEGFVSKVVIEEDEGLDEATRNRIRRYVDHIVDDRPLTAAVLERYMLLVNDLTGVAGRAVLSSSDTVQGAAELRLVAARDSLSGYAGITNRGSKFQGPWQVVGQAETNDALGGYGGFRVFGVTTGSNDELHHVTVARNQYVGSEGTTVSAVLGRTWSRPGAFLAPLEIDIDSVSFDLIASHPFERRRTRNLTGRAQLSITTRRLDVPDSGAGDFEARETEDKIRSLRVGLSYDRVDRYGGVNIIEAELSQGLDILGASETPSPQRSRPDGESRYTKATAYAARAQQIAGPWSVLGSLFGQYSADTLLSAEQCGVGGPNFARAYDQSEIVGDSCLMGLLELRYTRDSALSWLDNYVGYAFVDGGRVYRRSVAAGEADRDHRKSWGGGVRFRIKRRLSGSLEVAVPLDDDVAAERSDDPRVFVVLTGEF